MGINLGDVFPDFSADSSQGPLKWHTYIDGSWSILFSHPADYTPVCTTELGTVASYEEEFNKRGVKLAALSCNDAESHKGWIKDIESTKFAHGSKVSYPIVCDPKRELAVKFGMLDPDEKDAAGLAMTARAVFIIGPDKKLKLSILYPATTGRNFDEILRVIDSLQLTAEHSVATPANWNHGDKCMVVPSLSDEDAKKKLGSFVTTEVPSGKKYIRMTDDPSVKSGPVHTLLTPVRLLGGGLKNVGNLLARE
uniref:Peroxiredoxin n=2 Tax=Tetraselmis chuii TaxID=63592 RepID=A0A7S1T8C7_9CHLO